MNKILFPLIVICGLVGGFVMNSDGLPKSKPINNTGGSTSSTQVIRYNGVNNQSALDLLKKNHQVTTEQRSSGPFVIGIDGVLNAGRFNWGFYVNDKPAASAAYSYQTKKGEVIEWRYEESSY